MIKRKIVLRIILLILLLSLMATIFVFSHQPATVSGQVSGGLIYRFLNFIVSGFDSLTEAEKAQMVEDLQYIVRKGAHALCYSTMGALSMGLMSTFDFKKRVLPAVFAFLISFLYSVSDEVHQLFIEGRSGQFSDVILDGCGAILGIVVVGFFIWIVRKRRQSRNIKEKVQKT